MTIAREISLVLPVFNEEESIERIVRSICLYASHSIDTYEIIIVNDGSTDKTADVLDQLTAEFDIMRVVKHVANRGYGMALISGFNVAHNAIVGFMDADGQFDIKDIEQLLSYCDSFDVVVGRRKNRKDSWERVSLGNIYSLIIRVLFGLSIRDINCGFKIFHKPSFDNMKLHMTGALIDAELLVKMKRLGCSIKEVDVTHFSRRNGIESGGRIHVIARAMRELWSLFLEVRMGREQSTNA